MRPDVGALLLVASWLAIACASAPQDPATSSSRLHRATPQRAAGTDVGPSNPGSLGDGRAQLVILKPMIDGSYALGASDGPTQIWIDGQEARAGNGGALMSDDAKRYLDRAELPTVALPPGKHDIRFTVRRSNGSVEQRGLALDALAEHRYVLVTFEAPAGRGRSPVGSFLIGAASAPTPFGLIAWPVIIGLAAIAEVAKPDPSAREPLPPGCPGYCIEWIEDADSGTVVAGERP